MITFCIISSIVIGLLSLYTVYQNDKDEINWVRNPKNGEYVKILSSRSPGIIKFVIALSFVPFINLLWLAVILWDFFYEE